MPSLLARGLHLFPDRERRQRIWSIALPIMGGMMSQNVLNLVDIGMVGRLGDEALAARRLGEGRETETAIPLNGGLILARNNFV